MGGIVLKGNSPVYREKKFYCKPCAMKIKKKMVHSNSRNIPAVPKSSVRPHENCSKEKYPNFFPSSGTNYPTKEDCRHHIQEPQLNQPHKLKNPPKKKSSRKPQKREGRTECPHCPGLKKKLNEIAKEHLKITKEIKEKKCV